MRGLCRDVAISQSPFGPERCPKSGVAMMGNPGKGQASVPPSRWTEITAASAHNNRIESLQGQNHVAFQSKKRSTSAEPRIGDEDEPCSRPGTLLLTASSIGGGDHTSIWSMCMSRYPRNDNAGGTSVLEKTEDGDRKCEYPPYQG